ncbi:hypothetical protein V2J09_005666 [Rumex salicifolius]
MDKIRAAPNGRNIKGQTELPVAVILSYFFSILVEIAYAVPRFADIGETRNCRTLPSHQSLAKTTKQWMCEPLKILLVLSG